MIVLDRLGNEVDFSELFMEETLSAKDRKELDDSMYGIVYTDVDGNKVRKYPLNDEKHVLQAVRFFNKAEEKYKPELARKIIKRAKELDMEWENWDVLKPYLDKPVKESYVQENFDDLFGYILETYKPYDEYLKLHQYDSKTNTIVINGKRVNAGKMGSNKERNRINKFLRENNYNPKDGTIETRIDQNGQKKRVEFNINPHDEGSSSEYILRDPKTGKTVGKDFDVNISPKTMMQKPGLSNQTYQHEVTHGDIHLNPDKYKKELEESNNHNIKKMESGAYLGGNSQQVDHAMNPEENIADLHGAKNNPYGSSWQKTDMNKLKSEEDKVKRSDIKNLQNKNDRINSNIKYENQYYHDEVKSIDAYIDSVKRDIENAKKKSAEGDYLRRSEKELLKYTDDDIKRKAEELMRADHDEIDRNISERYANNNKRFNEAKNRVEKRNRSFNNEMDSRAEYVQKHLNQNNQQSQQPTTDSSNKDVQNNNNQNQNSQTTQQQTTNNTSPPPIQESFNEMFGEKVSLKNMYQESSTDMMKVDDLECDELYFGSDTKYPVEIDLNRPLFVTPLKGIASIFVGRADLKGIIPKGSYNLDYKEWRLPDKELMKPLKTVHVYVEGYPDLKEQEITLKGYIHCIPFKYYKNNIYRYPWMSKGVKYLIANTDNMKVKFTRIIECEVKYIVKGVPSDNPKYGPYKNMNEMIEGWRVTHKGEGIYEALKNAMWNITRTPKAWTEFKNSEACSWLPEPPLYGSNDRSYFTRLGYDTFMERTFPIMKKYLNEDDIEVSQTVVSSSDIVYRDQYQFVTDKSKTIQEAASDPTILFRRIFEIG